MLSGILLIFSLLYFTSHIYWAPRFLFISYSVNSNDLQVDSVQSDENKNYSSNLSFKHGNCPSELKSHHPILTKNFPHLLISPIWKLSTNSNEKYLFKVGENVMERPAIFHNEQDACNERLYNQLSFMNNYSKIIELNNISLPVLTIFAWGMDEDNLRKSGRSRFHGCPIDQCEFLPATTTNYDDVDILFWDNYPSLPALKRPRNPNQLWVVHHYENPYNTRDLSKFRGLVNFTSGYRMDNTIPIPYNIFTYFEEGVYKKPQTINYAAGKSRKVAWIVSNCNANNQRWQFAQELSKYIQVDIFGRCSGRKCDGDCWEMVEKHYKFYLSFENANCRHYITEKFFDNAIAYVLI